MARFEDGCFDRDISRGQTFEENLDKCKEGMSLWVPGSSAEHLLITAGLSGPKYHMGVLDFKVLSTLGVIFVMAKYHIRVLQVGLSL